MSRYLCQELMEQIFEKLPVKSLVRFRSLSKLWYSRIASPEFISRHNLPKTQTKVVIKHPGRKYDIYTLHTEDRLSLDLGPSGYIGITGVEFPAVCKVYGSCNGILCLLHSVNDKTRISLWNFSIRRKLTLPDHPFLKELSIQYNWELAAGFGFDPITNDYKIVVVTTSFQNSAFVYSMKTDSWTEIAYPSCIGRLKVNSMACFFNGALHWVVNDYNDEFIMTFNLSSHAFDKICLRPHTSETTTRLVTVINGSLAVISSNAYDTSIWVMEEYNNDNTWYELRSLGGGQFHEVKVLQNGDLVLLAKRRNYHSEMETYVESLELLDKGIPCGETIFPFYKTNDHKRKSKTSSLDFDDEYCSDLIYMIS